MLLIEAGEAGGGDYVVFPAIPRHFRRTFRRGLGQRVFSRRKWALVLRQNL